jgi:hypothetical protein
VQFAFGEQAGGFVRGAMVHLCPGTNQLFKGLAMHVVLAICGASVFLHSLYYIYNEENMYFFIVYLCINKAK